MFKSAGEFRHGDGFGLCHRRASIVCSRQILPELPPTVLPGAARLRMQER